ncbi:hypothetical protein RFI_19669, partial [Reticulomyxa filosa]
KKKKKTLCLYAWDFYADIIFDLNLLNYSHLRWLFYVSLIFLVVPWVSNLISLSRYQNKWTRDYSVRERVYQWFITWQRLLYALTALTGSAFGTVELANSFVFGLDFFCMGLSERHLKQYNQTRLFASIIPENLPQLAIQFYFLAHRGFVLDPIVGLAIASSLLSMIAAFLDIYSSRRLFAVIKDSNGEYVNTCTLSMSVKSKEVQENQQRLQISTYAFRDVLAEVLSLDPRAVEMHFPIATAHGFKVKYSIFSSKVDANTAVALIQESITKKELSKRICMAWHLDRTPEVDDLKVEDVVATNNPISKLENNLEKNLKDVELQEGGDRPNNNNNNNNNNPVANNVNDIVLGPGHTVLELELANDKQYAE